MAFVALRLGGEEDEEGVGGVADSPWRELGDGNEQLVFGSWRLTSPLSSCSIPAMKADPKPRAAKKPPRPTQVRDALLLAIKRSGLSSRQIAEDSGIDESIVIRFRAGKRSLKLRSVDALADTLGLELMPRSLIKK